MSALAATLGELVGLFVEDAGLALFSALAIAAATLLVKVALAPPLWGAIALALGCAVALAASLRRASRKAR